MYGNNNLARTGAAMAGLTAAGILIPWYALGAAALVIFGAIVLRVHHRLTTRADR